MFFTRTCRFRRSSYIRFHVQHVAIACFFLLTLSWMNLSQGREADEVDPSPELIRTEICIVGGGSAGYSAAIAAARNGTDCILIEQCDKLGGTSTLARVSNWEPGPGGPLTREIFERMEQIGATAITSDQNADRKLGAFGLWTADSDAIYDQTLRRSGLTRPEWHGAVFDPNALHDVVLEILAETGRCRVMLNTRYTEANVEGRRVRSILAESASGTLYEIEADYFIDSTGGGSLCADAGCETMLGPDSHDRFNEPSAVNDAPMMLNAISLCYVIRRSDSPVRQAAPDPSVSGWQRSAHVSSMPSPSVGLTEPDARLIINPLAMLPGTALIDQGYDSCYEECRRNVEAHWHWLQGIETFSSYEFDHFAPRLGIRESRRVVTDYVLREQDVKTPVSESTHPDLIAVADHSLDVHGSGGRRIHGETKAPYGIPYRCLLPRDVDNVLVACRGAGFSQIAASSCRLSRTMIQIGRAAGTAAALCEEQDCDPREVDADLLRRRLGFDRPNIVLIMTDDQGYGDYGRRGAPHLQTPRIDALAASGTEIPRFYCNTVCAPTRAGLMTGRDYYRTGVIHTSRGGAKMHGDEVTIAERLRGLGYTTGIFGKWHLGDNAPMRPSDQGFDESLIHASGGIGQPPDDPNTYLDPVLRHNNVLEPSTGYCTDVFTDAAIDFLTQHRDDPFFVYLPYNVPHTPLEIDDQYAAPFLNAGLDETTARIYGMLVNLDENIGRLLDSIEEQGLRENTIIIFFGDNGPQQTRYNAGLRGRKSSPYEGGIRTGAFFSMPGRIPSGRVADAALASHIDIAPTLIELARQSLFEREMRPDLHLASSDEPPAPFDGISLLPLLMGETETTPERTLFLQCHRSLTPQPYQNAAVVTDQFKLVGFPGTFNNEQLDTTSGEPVLELYDLTADPGETTDLADTRPEIVADLRQRYDSWFDEMQSERVFAPVVIDLGSDAENPARLCRYQDGNYVDGLAYGWPVRVARSGVYRIEIDRGEAEGAGLLHVEWQDEKLSQPVDAETNEAFFTLSEGEGVLEVYFVPNGEEYVRLGAKDTEGDVVIELVDILRL